MPYVDKSTRQQLIEEITTSSRLQNLDFHSHRHRHRHSYHRSSALVVRMMGRRIHL